MKSYLKLTGLITLQVNMSNYSSLTKKKKKPSLVPNFECQANN